MRLNRAPNIGWAPFLPLTLTFMLYSGVSKYAQNGDQHQNKCVVRRCCPCASLSRQRGWRQPVAGESVQRLLERRVPDNGGGKSTRKPGHVACVTQASHCDVPFLPGSFKIACSCCTPLVPSCHASCLSNVWKELGRHSTRETLHKRAVKRKTNLPLCAVDCAAGDLLLSMP